MSHWGEAGLDVDDQEGLVDGRLRGGRGDGGADAAAGDLGWSGWPLRWQASSYGGHGGLWNTELQMQQSPHWAGFVGFDWWAGVI